MTMDLNGIFNPQNKFFMFMEKVMNLCLLGILWALFSLPVITVGASTAALFQYTLRLTRDEEGYVWKSFWNAFKKNFVPATMVWGSRQQPQACFWWQICTAVSFCPSQEP